MVGTILWYSNIAGCLRCKLGPPFIWPRVGVGSGGVWQVEPKISVLDYLKRIDKYFACSVLAAMNINFKYILGRTFHICLGSSREGMDGKSDTLLQVMQLTRLSLGSH